MSLSKKVVKSIYPVTAACAFTVLSSGAIAGGEAGAAEAAKEPAAGAATEGAGEATAAPAAAAGGDKPYSIVDGKVDANTFEGWQTYRVAGCGQCHGGAAQGGAAPSLVERLKTISQEQFNTSVLEGKNLMPPWKNNKKVVDNLDKLYAYVKARSDGALGEDKPVKQ